MGKNCSKEASISFILRVAFVVIFGTAALSKFMMGLGASAQFITGMFQKTWLPAPMVSLYAALLPWVEAAIAVWLLLGINLKGAWVLTSFALISLGFGLMVAQSPMSAGVFTYLLIACVGLYFSDFDQCNIKNLGKK